MEKCNHKYSDGSTAIEQVLFYDEDEHGREKLEVDYEFCALCGKRFCVSG